jgi:sugar/nucleoside kinase (ribokinase family)
MAARRAGAAIAGAIPWGIAMKAVICSGAVIHDTLVRPVEEPRWGTTTIVETIEQHTGGNAANTSIALATLGVPVRTMGAVGRDAQGRFVLDTLTRAGVDTRAVAELDAPTAATVGLVNAAGNRKFLHRPGVSAQAFSAPLDFPADLVEGKAHYHLASLFILPNFRPHAPATLARARAAGLTTSLDTNWDPRGEWMRALGPCLPGLDFLFMNEDEARMAGETPAGILTRGVGTFVLKLGPRGCAIYTAAGETLVPAFEVPVIDTTGAGDCFVAAFLAAWLRGSSLEEAARFANAVGALVVQRVGASSGVLSYEETQAWMERLS